MSIINMLPLEFLLIDRLQTELGDLASVFSSAEVSQYVDVTEKCPAVFIQPGESTVTDHSDGGTFIAERQAWDIIVCVRQVRKTNGLSANYESAGQLMGAVHTALSGWRPPAHAPMRYSGRQQYVPQSGWVEFVMQFETVWSPPQ